MTTTRIKKDTLAEVHFLLGYAKEKQNQGDEAVKNYRLALEKNDHHGEAHFRLGVSLSKDNLEFNAEEVKHELEKAIELNCDDQANAHYYLGKALVKKEEYYGATKNLIEARNLFKAQVAPEKVKETNSALQPCADYWYKEGEKSAQNKNYEEAIKWYKNATIIFPDWAEAYCQMERGV